MLLLVTGYIRGRNFRVRERNFRGTTNKLNFKDFIFVLAHAPQVALVVFRKVLFL